MKILLTTTFLFVAILVFSQSELEKKMSKDICFCIDSFKIKRPSIESDFSECFLKAVYQDVNLITKEVFMKYGDSTQESTEKLGKYLGNKISVSLVKDCYSYFVLVDSFRYLDYIKN